MIDIHDILYDLDDEYCHEYPTDSNDEFVIMLVINIVIITCLIASFIYIIYKYATGTKQQNTLPSIDFESYSLIRDRNIDDSEHVYDYSE